ncbi:MAG: response regulator transcription factor [Cytophagales bacterium]|nr:response regulator transcription factor [Cytophagales bacterium]
MQVTRELKHILLYGLILAALIFGLKWLQWNFLILDNAIDIYIGLIAVVFTVLGVWIASQSIKPKTETVIVEKKVIVPQSKTFILNEAALRELALTNREFEILQLIAKGHSNSKIADHLFLSLSTIKTHVSNLFTKMNVNSRFQAITRAKELELVE